MNDIRFIDEAALEPPLSDLARSAKLKCNTTFHPLARHHIVTIIGLNRLIVLPLNKKHRSGKKLSNKPSHSNNSIEGICHSYYVIPFVAVHSVEIFS